jgi:hypothetical protein
MPICVSKMSGIGEMEWRKENFTNRGMGQENLQAGVVKIEKNQS